LNSSLNSPSSGTVDVKIVEGKVVVVVTGNVVLNLISGRHNKHLKYKTPKIMQIQSYKMSKILKNPISCKITIWKYLEFYFFILVSKLRTGWISELSLEEKIIHR